MSVMNFELKNAVRKRLDMILREKLPEFMCAPLSNGKIRRLIVAGGVSVDGKIVRSPSFSVCAGAVIKIRVDEEKLFFEKKTNDIEFELEEKNILFEDEYIILIDKPAFFPVEKTFLESRDNLHDALVRYLWKKNPHLLNPPYAGIMHRLDRETSGVILFTKQRSVNAAVHEMFDFYNNERRVSKVYRAVCSQRSGGIKHIGDKFSVEMFMGRISSKTKAGKWGRLSESDGGVFSHTDFFIKDEKNVGGKNLLYIEARPATGRTHQIRVHLSDIGLPIMGDSLYGGAPSLLPSGRIMLHSLSLTFTHPVSKKEMTVSSVLPDGF
ncbi:RluA family pseudouridine synthase [Treponema parvum]|uniref:RluA family pseudouridine synthase n=1 Tax=Treponema parvum TaxID=138851 RepID=UPI001AEBB3A3|nr:RluA family pseudouridine synthase [Treponema parvum]QTQ16866.1 RluA family pseudouridine synthase [Treponema parvum]